MRSRLLLLAGKLVLATSRTPLRTLWAAIYRAVAVGVAAWLGRRERAGVYLRGSSTGRDVAYGLSDLDLAVIAANDEGASQIGVRADRLAGRLLPVGIPVECHYVMTATAVAQACAANVFTHGLDGRGPLTAASPLQERPQLAGDVVRWRRLWGRELRPADPERRLAELERPAVAWLELQFWWRHACVVLTRPGVRWRALSCVKLIAEPLRTLMWLRDGNPRGSRTEVLQEARRRLPAEERAIAHALDLWRRLPSSPEPDVGLVVSSLARVSACVAQRTRRLADASGYELVALEGREADRPLPTAADSPRLPLVDWRARTLKSLPDPVFFVAEGDGADAARVAELAAVAKDPVFAALLHGDGVMVLPTADPVSARQRGAQCPASDPVSFALAAGRDEAAFAELPGWSAHDATRRAVHEHRVRLHSSERYEPDDGTGLARLFAAARAALMARSRQAGDCVLSLTVTATAQAMVDSGADRATVDDAVGWYLDGRGSGASTPDRVLTAMRAQVLALEPYAGAPVEARA